MTTVWPIIVLGFVATILLLLPALLKGTWLVGGERAVQQEETAVDDERGVSDRGSGNFLCLSYLFVCGMLPLTVLLLLLWGAAARSLGNNSWYIPLAIILPSGIGALTAWNQQRRGDEGETGD